MKGLCLELDKGKVTLIDMPPPAVKSRFLLIATKKSLISTGTERMLIEFGRGSLIEKVKKQPERLREVIRKIKTDGLAATLELVRAKLGEPIPLGYCNVGVVMEVGRGVEGFSKGDRVVSNGSHAEVVSVPQTLCAKIPNNVDDETAVFTVPASIALEGIRLLVPSLGEYIVVMGLGLIGQLAVQLLVASGCKVLGIDLSKDKVKLAEEFGAEGLVLNQGESPVERALSFSKGRGVDGVLITAATESNEPVEFAAQMCRKRGKIVLVGVTGTKIPRNLFYEKELTFQVSSSYGPGRYDPIYEDKGIDYPYGYVRWTARRNFEAVLEMMAEGRIDVKPLVSHGIPFDRAPEAYEVLLKEVPLGILLEYKGQPDLRQKTVELKYKVERGPEEPVVGFIGAGNFAKLVLLPALKDTSARLKILASAGGVSGAISAKRFGFERATSDYEEVLKDPEINTVFIVTRHNSHAKLAALALRKSKNVFVEKPLSITLEGLADVVKAHREAGDKILMVGFNRRFSPFTMKIREAVSMRGDPLCLSMTVNAGFIPSTHWVHDEEVGGSRLLGEACHFIDLLRFLVGSPVLEVYAISTKGHSERDDDKVTITVKFKDGSIGVINYFSNGNKTYPKERLEVFYEGKVVVLDNFKRVKGYGLKMSMRSLKQDKGHKEEISSFIRAVKEGSPFLIPFDELVEVTLATFAAKKSMEEGRPVKIRELEEELQRMISGDAS